MLTISLKIKFMQKISIEFLMIHCVLLACMENSQKGSKTWTNGAMPIS